MKCNKAQPVEVAKDVWHHDRFNRQVDDGWRQPVLWSIILGIFCLNRPLKNPPVAGLGTVTM